MSKLYLRAAIGIVALGCILLFVFFQRSYPEISKRGFEHGLALLSVCNRQDHERLSQLANQIQADISSNKLSQQDAKVLLPIVSKAQAGEWRIAIDSARALLDSQVDSSVALKR